MSKHLEIFFLQAFKDRDPACLSYCSVLLYLKVLLEKTLILLQLFVDLGCELC